MLSEKPHQLGVNEDGVPCRRSWETIVLIRDTPRGMQSTPAAILRVDSIDVKLSLSTPSVENDPRDGGHGESRRLEYDGQCAGWSVHPTNTGPTDQTSCRPRWLLQVQNVTRSNGC
ncbi:hypothetical protein LIA77_07310 [Sarocladium implicatum]|nr:hypothetical protein LIA77_07310 [Sarocladium implicatum]